MSRENKKQITIRMNAQLLRRVERVAKKMRRTKISILEQLVELFCTTKNLQP